MMAMEKNKYHKKRTVVQRTEDMELMIKLYLENVPQYRMPQIIKKELKRTYTITRQQITYDLAKMRKLWKERHESKIHHYYIEQLAKLDRMEREAWEAWNKSKQGKNGTSVNRKRSAIVPRGSTPDDLALDQIEEGTKVTQTQTHGDSAYFKMLQWCWEQKTKLLDLWSPTKVQVSHIEQSVRSMDEVELLEALKSSGINVSLN